MEIFDIVDEKGIPTGETIERTQAHEKGVRHRTAHIWIVREQDGKAQLLLQKRSAEKDSFPGRFDTSSAGHIQAGDEPEESAIRELHEELGIRAAKEDLTFAGRFDIQYEKEFYGKMFRDNEVASVSLSMPLPVSDTSMKNRLPSRHAVTLTLPYSGVNLKALESRLLRTLFT